MAAWHTVGLSQSQLFPVPIMKCPLDTRSVPGTLNLCLSNLLELCSRINGFNCKLAHCPAPSGLECLFPSIFALQPPPPPSLLEL